MRDVILTVLAEGYSIMFIGLLITAWKEAYGDQGQVGNRPQPSEDGFSWADGPDTL